ncbi:TIGR03862 family flavoprotein [Pelagibius sp. Alg239-R121]|uniref:TIGR03862 family flavoprotein n=1 Tax=Pelagibius sp. Alg239-R121 TaxID=2993448 RepID=UPI0024A78DDF|nr:TIGR03862 family flavoprotein [Pelagibius sp. Alg239-R121]
MDAAVPRIAIVGGGPAGLMAAQILSRKNFTVTLYEAKASFGRKFLLAGRGGLNLTHSETIEQFLKRYGPNLDFFRGKISHFSPNDLRAWSDDLGVPTFVGSSGRVFPTSLKASPLLRAWLVRLRDQGVVLKPEHRLTKLAISRGQSPSRSITLDLLDQNGARLEDAADAVLLALGGASWPRMGSDGRWLEHLKAMGVACADFQPSNCGFDVQWSEIFAQRHAGTALKNLLLKTDAAQARGEIMIARYGVEGGGIYALGRTLREELKADGTARVVLDLKPDLEQAKIAQRLATQRPKDSLSSRLRKSIKLSPAATALIRECVPADSLTTPDLIAQAVKAVPLTLTASQSLERAISSTGGVQIEGLSQDLMIKSLPGVFAAGEMLDWDAPTGGYLLQGTIATAVCAAEGVERWMLRNSNGSLNS